MLKSHSTNEIKPGENTKLAGWVEDVRDLGKIAFIILRDSYGSSQILLKKDNKLIEKARELRRGFVITVSGIAVENKQAPNGIEIMPDKIEILSRAEPLPIDASPKVKTSLDKRLDFRPVDLRTPKNAAIFKIQSELLRGFQKYLDKNNFVQVFTPSIMGVASESGSDVFPIVYYDKEAFLRQDPQLHRQLTILGGFEKIYDIGPSWRAEPSHTVRHLCEHRVCAAEIAFIEDETDIIKLEEQMVISMMKHINKECKKELDIFNIKINIPDKFPVLEFPKIYDILKKMGKPVQFGEECDTEAEKLLTEYTKKKYNSDFFFINRFPFGVKPFYVMRFDNDPIWARSTDLIYKGTEMSSGGQREHRHDKLIAQAKEKNMSQSSVEWFTKFFRYGAPPHGGFAIGIERLTMKILELENIREAVLFPRDVERIVP
ncbi:MAG: aspartate--tRNA(Asn) ligase [Candidatus Aenigmarchaeota archaeon]|nr:aspartate--tRNA(Asn) ligase [Candidatus Aenigmarchaeota archaeon]